MKHRVFGKRLGRDTKGRRALIKSLVIALVDKERIVTTNTKAKILKSVIDKLINKAKKRTLAARRQIIAQIGNPKIAAKITDDLALRFADRSSGFTRSARLGARTTDRAQMSVLEFIVGVKPVSKKAELTTTVPVKTITKGKVKLIKSKAKPKLKKDDKRRKT